MSQVIRPPKRTKRPQPTFNLRRFRAALDLRGETVEDVARAAQVSTRHIWYCLNGQRRASSRLLGVISATLGESGFAFATCQTDSLIDSPPTVPPVESEGLAMGGER